MFETLSCDFASPSGQTIYHRHQETQCLFEMFRFSYDSDNSTELTNAETASESTSSAILKFFSFNT
jgi:hypothetical protein